MREDWETVKLGEFATYEKGKKPKNQKTEPDDVFKFPYINIEAFEKGTIETYTDGEKCRFCFKGDFLMVWDGSRSGLVGKGMDGALGSTLVRINLPGIENNYAYHFLSSKYQEINTRAKGSGTPHVDPYLLWNYDFSICSLSEQRAIVAKIEELFSELDKGEEDLKKAQEQLKIYRQAVLKKAFEGDWDKVKLGSVCDKVLKVKRKEMPLDTRLLYLDIGGIDNVRNKIINHKEYKWENAPSRAQQIIKVGDVLFSTVRTYLKNIARVENPIYENQVASSGFTVIRGKTGILDSKYIFYITTSEFFLEPLNELQRGTSYPAVRDKDVYSQLIPLPNFSEQENIVREIESRLSVCNSIEVSISQSLDKSKALRQSILKKAFEGTLLSEEEIAACKAAPDYEPTSVLLERIKAEKKKK